MKMDGYTEKKIIPHYGAIRAGIRQASRGTRGGSGKGKKKGGKINGNQPRKRETRSQTGRRSIEGSEKAVWV